MTYSKNILTDAQIAEYRLKVLEIIQKHGHFIQGVSGMFAYTIGRAKNGFEIITPCNLGEGLVGELCNIEDEPVAGKVYTTENYKVKGEDLRFTYLLIEDPEDILKMAEESYLGWTNPVYGEIPKKVYSATVGDPNNALPGEEGYYNSWLKK